VRRAKEAQAVTVAEKTQRKGQELRKREEEIRQIEEAI
jgi:hypothetical protein